jgi:glycosyltransferase involved in cell wall biosynthesis
MKKKLLRITTSSVSIDLLLKGQLAFMNRYFEVVGVASDDGYLEKVARREGIRTVEVKMNREISLWADFGSLLTMVRVMRREKPFIVHVSTPKGSLIGLAAAWLCRVPHRLYTVTGLRFETATGSFRRLLIFMERLTCRFATRVIPEGEGVKKTLIREKITKKPLQKILNGNINGIDLQHFRLSEEVMEAAAAIRKEAFTFCFIGRLVRDKGINELVKAFDELYRINPAVCLLLVGPLEQELDPVEPEVLQMILHHSGISSVGFQDDVRPFLAASDALVFPSYREGFPNVVLQAGAMGLASIVTDINGSNEIILEGKNGVIIPPKNQQSLFEAMKYFAENKELVAGMAANARPLIESRFEQRMIWEAILKEYAGLGKS